jgi:hypothetical protein
MAVEAKVAGGKRRTTTDLERVTERVASRVSERETESEVTSIQETMPMSPGRTINLL